jgi:ferredoxin
MLVVQPDECIDCGVCVPECPVDAIKPDTDPDSGQTLQSKEHPRPTQGLGRGSRINSNTSHQILVRVIEVESAISMPDLRLVPDLTFKTSRGKTLRSANQIGQLCDADGDASRFVAHVRGSPRVGFVLAIDIVAGPCHRTGAIARSSMTIVAREGARTTYSAFSQRSEFRSHRRTPQAAISTVMAIIVPGAACFRPGVRRQQRSASQIQLAKAARSENYQT